MHPVLAVTLQAMQADMGRMDRVAMNLANAQTPGYKREAAAAGEFAQALRAQGLGEPDSAATGSVAGVHLDLRQGTMKTTGQGLDLALSGPGWFEVLTEQGPAYTRLGNFRRDAQGRMVTAQGLPVAGTGGEIQLPEGPVSIDAAGRIFEAVVAEGGVARVRSAPAAQLKVVAFEDQAVAHRLGDGLVRFTGAPQRSEAGAEVRQGYLENANVSSMQEMVQLMQTMRHFESLQKVALSYDEMLGNAIRKLGDGS